MKKRKDPRKKKIYHGYQGDADFFDMPPFQFERWCAGKLLMSIGEGRYQDGFHTVQQMSMAYGAYHNDLP